MNNDTLKAIRAIRAGLNKAQDQARSAIAAARQALVQPVDALRAPKHVDGTMLVIEGQITSG